MGKLSYEENYQSKLRKWPSIHPAHPYKAVVKHKGKSRTLYVSATSLRRAELAGLYWFNILKGRKVKFENLEVYATPRFPIEKNRYWDQYNRTANPNTLKLSDFKGNA